MPTYFNLTAFGAALVWEASGVFLKVGKYERYFPSTR